jgi:hypothetical protein
VTKKTLLEGRCEGGPYPLKPHPQNQSPPNKQAFSAIKPSTSLWHNHLGHASSPVVQKVLSRHKLLFSKESNKGVICDVYQMGKSHQLPYPKSNSVSSKPFELVFSDVWGPAPTSMGRYSYYVSFIDDFSKSLGSICCDISHKFFNAFVTSKVWLSANVITKSWLFNRTGKGSTSP